MHHAPRRYINPHKAPVYWQELGKRQKHAARKIGQKRQATEREGRGSRSETLKKSKNSNARKAVRNNTDTMRNDVLQSKIYCLAEVTLVTAGYLQR